MFKNSSQIKIGIFTQNAKQKLQNNNYILLTPVTQTKT